MVQHRGIDIKLTERPTVIISTEDLDLTVKNGEGLVFMASSKFNTAFARTMEDAVKLAQRAIDRVLDAPSKL